MAYEPTLEDIEKLDAELAAEGYVSKGDIMARIDQEEKDKGFIGSLKKRLRETTMKEAPMEFAKGFAKGALEIPNVASEAIRGKPIYEMPETHGLAGLAGEWAVPGAIAGKVAKGIKIAQAPKFMSGLAEAMFQKSPELLRKYGTKAVEGAGVLGKNALFGAGLTAATENPRNPEYLSNVATGATLGAGLAAAPAILKAAGRGIKGITGIGTDIATKTLFPDVYAKRHLLEGISPEEIKPAVEAAERLGITIQPHEATRNYLVGQKVGNVGKSTEGAKVLQKFGEERQETIESGLNKFLDRIYKKEVMSPKKNKLYEESSHTKVPEETISNLKDNEVFKEAVKRIENNPAFVQVVKEKKLDKNSVGYLDLIKKSLGELEKRAKTAGDNEQKLIYESARKELTTKLDEISPEYRSARQLSERSIARKKIEKAMRSDEYTPTSIYRKVLKNKEKFDELSHNLRNVEGAQQTLKDMKSIYKNLQEPASHKQAASQERIHVSKPRELTQSIFKIIMKTTGKHHDKAMAELITNPRWHEKVSEIKSIKNPKNQASEFSKLLSQALAQSMIKSNKNGNANGKSNGNGNGD